MKCFWTLSLLLVLSGTLHFVETFSWSCILSKLLKSLHFGETFLQFVETMICILAKVFATRRNCVLHSVETFLFLVETVLHFGETFLHFVQTFSSDFFDILIHMKTKIKGFQHHANRKKEIKSEMLNYEISGAFLNFV